MTRSRIPQPCANEGCRRPSPEGDAWCETCAMERSLYERHTRAGQAGEGRSLERALFRRDTRAEELSP